MAEIKRKELNKIERERKQDEKNEEKKKSTNGRLRHN